MQEDKLRLSVAVTLERTVMLATLRVSVGEDMQAAALCVGRGGQILPSGTQG